jgi:hypothetical protein
MALLAAEKRKKYL